MDIKKSKLIRQLMEFKKQNKIEKVYLFGSMASGIVHRWSDVDLIIVSKRFRRKGILRRSPPLRMRWNLDYPVDMLCYTPEEFEVRKRQPSIVKEAVETGIEIK